MGLSLSIIPASAETLTEEDDQDNVEKLNLLPGLLSNYISNSPDLFDQEGEDRELQGQPSVPHDGLDRRD